MTSTLVARRTNLGMFKNHNEKLNFRKNESDSRYITFRLVYNGINQRGQKKFASDILPKFKFTLYHSIVSPFVTGSIEALISTEHCLIG